MEARTSHDENPHRFQTRPTKFMDPGGKDGESTVDGADGQLITDIRKHCCDKQDMRALNHNANVNGWCPVQIILSLTTLILAERGFLDVSEKISKYWPEYVASGKKDIEVRHFLSHNVDLSACDKRAMIEDVSQLIRRTDGRCLEQFITEEIAGSCRIDVHQKDVRRVPVGQHHEGPFESQSQSLMKDSNDLDFQNGQTFECFLANGRYPNSTKLYPEAIPPHPDHPHACDFSVVDQGHIGKALVTHRSWQQGDFMARFDGMTVPKVMLHTLQKTNSIHLWDPHFVGNLAHSCKPNVMLDMAEHEMWAVQDIEPGTVLSMDYASTEDHLFRTFDCECTALGCRGEVTGRKQRRGGHTSVSQKSI